MSLLNWMLLTITVALALAGLGFLLACVWYDEIENGWDD